MRHADGYGFEETGRTDLALQQSLLAPLAEEGGEERHARRGNRICATRMRIMTSHDTSARVPPARMTKHDIS